MTAKREIYLLSPKLLSPETIAVAFAKTSRSPESFREIAAELSDEKSAQFHEKWVVGYGHACYDALTEVLTDKGWRRWPDLADKWQHGQHDFQLATLHPETGYLEYLPLVRLVVESYHGPMYRVRTRLVDLSVTPNHRMWVCTTRTRKGRQKQAFQLVPACDLEGVPCVYQLSARWEGPEPRLVALGDRDVDACALMRLTGFFIGDGYHDRRYHHAVSFHLRREREIQFLRKAVQECGFEWTLHGQKHYVTGAGLGDYLEQCYDDQRRKIIPSSLLTFGPALLMGLMEGLLNSDGHIDRVNHWLYSTTSEPLKDQLYEVALKLGWSAFAIKKEEQRVERKSRKPTYLIHINRTRLRPEVNKVRYRKQDEWEQYEGLVFCAEMPRNHTLYVRRNGRAVWSGNSVAEHAVLHIALENVSRLAIECLESNRLASYTEKSTRYQVWGPESFYTPRAIAESRHAERYRQACLALFEAYRASIEPVRRVMQAKYPRKENESEARWDGRIRSRYVDNCRFLLPAAALANVGLTANARVLESAIRKLLSHPLEEAREVGAEIKQVAQAEVPTLLKYADAVPYQSGTARALMKLACRVTPGQANGALSLLIDCDQAAENKFLAACLFRYGQGAFEACAATVAGMTKEQRAALADEALGRLGQHDVPLRELEHVTYTIDVVMDQGGYFELKRHRMMTQTPQPLSCDLGYAVPRAFEVAGLRAQYDVAMQAAAETYRELAQDFPVEASYVVPNGFNRRVLLTLNLREAFHVCELRGAPNAHFSVRRTAGQIFEAIQHVHPLLAGYMRRVDYPAWQKIEEEFFSAVE